TGYPVLFPLALFFKIFGFSLSLARIYMIGWMLLFLAGGYVLARRLFGAGPAAGAILLLSTFPPILGNGRTVTGEVPGITFLFWGLFFLLRSSELLGVRRMFFAGLCFGFMAAAKPIFVFILPAIFISKLFPSFRGNRREEFFLWIGIFLPIIFYIFTVLPPHFSAVTIREILFTYRHRASQAG